MAEIAGTVTTMTVGIMIGYIQLRRWEIRNRKSVIFLVIGAVILFLPGGYLMNRYGYHILKIIRYWILMYGLLLLALIDARRKMIPNKVLLVLLGIRTVLMAGECICFPQVSLEIIISAAAGLLGGSLLFLLARMIAGKGLGMGDIKMIGVMGYFLGFQVLMSDLIITMTLTVVAGLTVLVLRKASLKSEMPFAPFAAVGTMITILMGF